MNIKLQALLAAALLTLALPCMGQKYKSRTITDTQAAIRGIEKIIQNKKQILASPQLIESVVAEICDKQKKNPELYTAAANAFFYKSGIRDTLHALSYADKALAIDPKFVPAYLLKGEISLNYGDTAKAESWCRKAIEMSPQDPKGYKQLALLKEKGNQIDQAIAILKEAKAAIPTFPCNREIGRMYERAIPQMKAAGISGTALSAATDEERNYYEQAEADSMKASDYVNLAGIYYGFGSEVYAYYPKALETCETALAKFPNDIYALRTALMSAMESYQKVADKESKPAYAEKGIQYGKRFFEVGDTIAALSDYQYYAMALQAKGRYDEAIQLYTHLMNMPNATDENRSKAIGALAKIYQEQGEYDKADQAYSQYVNDKEKKGTLTFADLWYYAKMYLDKASESNGQEKIDTYMKADELYGKAAQLAVGKNDFGNASLAYYTMVQIRTQDEIDPGYKKGLAVEPAKAYYNMALAQGELSDTDKRRLVLPCHYLAIYYFKIKDNNKLARPYWVRLHELAPDNQQAIQVLRSIYKIKL